MRTKINNAYKVHNSAMLMLILISNPLTTSEKPLAPLFSEIRTVKIKKDEQRMKTKFRKSKQLRKPLFVPERRHGRLESETRPNHFLSQGLINKTQKTVHRGKQTRRRRPRLLGPPTLGGCVWKTTRAPATRLFPLCALGYHETSPHPARPGPTPSPPPTGSPREQSG